MKRFPSIHNPFRLVQRHRLALFLLLLMVVFREGEAEAQEVSRAELLEAARGEFDDALAIRLLVQAADPAIAAVDSVWAVSVHELAFALVRAGSEETAELWLRWSARHGPGWPLDRSWFPSVMGDIWDRASAAVEASERASPEMSITSWEWSEASGTGMPGQLQVDFGVIEGSTVTLSGPQGTEIVAASDLAGASLDPGTYEVSLTGEDLETAAFAIEVLPGVVTRLQAELNPVYSAASREEATRRLARIEWGGGFSACADGVVVGGGRAVVTPLSGLGSRSQLRAVLASGEVVEDLAVTATDELRGLALIRLRGDEPWAVEDTSEGRGSYAWVLYHGGCDGPTTAWTRLPSDGWGAAPFRPTPSLPLEATGAPLVDLPGRLVGVVMESGLVLSFGDDDPLIRSALTQQLAEGPQIPTIQRSGLPWKWIGAGAALAGVGAALAAGGGGGGGGPGTDGSPSGTGTIVIVLPGGGQ